VAMKGTASADIDLSQKAEKLLDNLIADKDDAAGVWEQPKLKSSTAGQAILALQPTEAHVLLRTLLPRLRAVDRVIIVEEKKSRRDWTRLLQQNMYVRNRYLPALGALLARKLPLEAEDVSAVVQTLREGPESFAHEFPLQPLIRALEYFIKDHGQAKLQADLKWLRQRLGEDFENSKLKVRLEKALASGPSSASKKTDTSAEKQPAAPASSEAAQAIAPLLEDVVGEIFVQDSEYLRVGPFRRKVEAVPSGKKILEQGGQEPNLVVNLALDRIRHLEGEAARFGQARRKTIDFQKIWQSRAVVVEILRLLLRRKLPLDEQTVVRLLGWPAESKEDFNPFVYPWPGLAGAAENYAEANGVSEPLQAALASLSHCLRHIQYPMAHPKEWRQTAERLEALINSGPQATLEPGEAWSDAVRADLGGMSARARSAWKALLLHCQAGGQGKCTDRWRKGVEPLLEAVGFDSFKEHLLRWWPLVDKPRTDSLESHEEWREDFGWIRSVGTIHNFQHLILPQHVELLRGLAWCAGLREDADLARALTRLAASAYRKIPSVGPRLISLGNACVTALGMMPGTAPIGQLAVLKGRVKVGTAQKEIDKAFHAAAAREGLPRDEVEELAVPSYGLEEVGRLQAAFGEYHAELTIDGSSAGLHWLKGDQPIKSVPATVKTNHAQDYKDLQAALKDITTMLPAQRERIDSLFLARKSWPLEAWRERYLDHPLVGTITRRLIWSFTAKGKTVDGVWHAGQLLGRNGRPLTLKEEMTVALWHPIDRPTEEVLAWRDWLERREVVQPFKQAHREIYVLTDAERRTGTYSNRFAAHVLRQHQFNALCAARGWKNRLRLMVDDSYPPAHRLLPDWGLRAEFWIEGAGSEYGQDTNPAGVYLYLTTDQVRFYPLDAPERHGHAGGGGYGRGDNAADEPLALATIPPLVFSEIMRDVDLFVGVASVGNDPNWDDGGPEGRYRDYWQTYSFGELSATAQTRRALLERLLPRLKIAGRCSLSDRFLHVRGDRRDYKIHLGSGNILMSPNDQYLCIVPKQAIAGHDRLFLPFEGDGTLSVILSKAFLLADDARITDPTITSQIGR
jgi:hypothetical protein